MTLHLLGQGHNSVLHTSALTFHPSTVVTESHRKVVNSQNDQLVENQALMVR